VNKKKGFLNSPLRIRRLYTQLQAGERQKFPSRASSSSATIAPLIQDPRYVSPQQINKKKGSPVSLAYMPSWPLSQQGIEKHLCFSNILPYTCQENIRHIELAQDYITHRGP
jgi:hypothetical protein